VPELNDTADITERISQEKAIRLHEQAITGQQKIPIDIRRRLYQAIVVNIALWGKLGTERSRGPNWKRSTMDVSARCAG
jgi:hypothetical protein